MYNSNHSEAYKKGYSQGKEEGRLEALPDAALLYRIGLLDAELGMFMGSMRKKVFLFFLEILSRRKPNKKKVLKAKSDDYQYKEQLEKNRIEYLCFLKSIDMSNEEIAYRMKLVFFLTEEELFEKYQEYLAKN